MTRHLTHTVTIWRWNSSTSRSGPDFSIACIDATGSIALTSTPPSTSTGGEAAASAARRAAVQNTNPVSWVCGVFGGALPLPFQSLFRR